MNKTHLDELIEMMEEAHSDPNNELTTLEQWLGIAKEFREDIKESKRIYIGCDHAGFDMKEYVVSELHDMGYLVKDFGCFSNDSVDYPDFGHMVADHVSISSNRKGIVICGSGNGINMSVNKHKNVRGALCWDEELAVLARQHNNSNILSLPARFISMDKAKKIVSAFLNTDFEGGRHERRVNKI